MNKKLMLLAACCAIASLSACNEAIKLVPPDGSCTEGERTCRGNAVAICVDGALTIEETCTGVTPICDPATLTCVAAQQNCTDGTKLCHGVDIRVCSNGKWETQRCESGTACDLVTLTCVAGQQNCTDDGTRQCYGDNIRVCTDGKWVTERCEGNTICDAATIECRTRLCADGAYKCEENRLYICGSEAWTLSQACGEDTLCDADRGMCVVKEPCMEDEPLCVGGNAVNCVDDVRITKICKENQDCVVDGGIASCIAVAECVEDTFECTGEAGYRICIDGTWLSDTCTGGKVCDATAENCVAIAECVEDTFECTETGYRICIDGAWEAETCMDGKVCDATAENCVAVAECSTTDDCEEGKVCNADGKCVASAGVSYSIDYAKTLGYNPDTSIMWGEVYSPDSPASTNPTPPAEILSQIVCTFDVSKALTSWDIVANAAFTGKVTGEYENNYEFSGEIAAIAEDTDRYCLMRFSGDDGATWHYALSDGSVLLSGTDILTDSSQAFLVAGGGAPTWVHIEGFESLTPVSNYASTNTVTIGDGSSLATLGMVIGGTVNPTYVIAEANSLVITGRDNNTGTRISLTGVPSGKGIGKIAFEWRSWGTTSDTGEVYITVGLVTQTLVFSNTDTTPKTWEFEFNDPTATSITINPESFTATSNQRRLIIDDIRWTYANP